MEYKNKSFRNKSKKLILDVHLNESEIRVDLFNANFFLSKLSELDSNKINQTLLILKQLLVLDFNASTQLLHENIDYLYKIVNLIFNQESSFNALLFLGILTESTDMFSNIIGTEEFFYCLIDHFDMFINERKLFKLLLILLSNMFYDSYIVISNIIKTNFLCYLMRNDLKSKKLNKLLYIVVTSNNLQNEIIIQIIRFFSTQIKNNSDNLKYALNTFIFFIKDLNYQKEIVHLILTYNLCSTFVKLIKTKYAIYSLEILKFSLVLSEEMIPQIIGYDVIPTIYKMLNNSSKEVLYSIIQLITSFLTSIQNFGCSEYYINSISYIYEYNFYDLFINGSFQVKTVLLQMLCALFNDIKIEYLKKYIFNDFIDSILEFMCNEANKTYIYNLLILMINHILNEEEENMQKIIFQKLNNPEFINNLEIDSQSTNQDLSFFSQMLLNYINKINSSF